MEGYGRTRAAACGHQDDRGGQDEQNAARSVAWSTGVGGYCLIIRRGRWGRWRLPVLTGGVAR
jgi:hypothetical protein